MKTCPKHNQIVTSSRKETYPYIWIHTNHFTEQVESTMFAGTESRDRLLHKRIMRLTTCLELKRVITYQTKWSTRCLITYTDYLMLFYYASLTQAIQPWLRERWCHNDKNTTGRANNLLFFSQVSIATLINHDKN